MANIPDSYQRSVEVHQGLEALYPRIEQYGAHFRQTSAPDPTLPRPVGRTPRLLLDTIVCALAIKAATTKRAIFAVCELDDGANAMALTRVVLENACLLEWLIRGKGRRRLEAYVMFTSVQHERVADMVQRHYARLATAGATAHVQSDPYHSAVWSTTFKDAKGKRVPTDRPTWEFDEITKQGKPISVREIFREIAGAQHSYEHEVLYGALGSDIVHSGPFSLSSIIDGIGDRTTFMLRSMPRPELRTLALAMSNAAMFLVFDSLTEYLGLSLSAELNALKTKAEDNAEEKLPV